MVIWKFPKLISKRTPGKIFQGLKFLIFVVKIIFS